MHWRRSSWQGHSMKLNSLRIRAGQGDGFAVTIVLMRPI
jgi:hypothetical protein